MILIKLGGSVITDKQKERTAKLNVIERLSREIADAGKDVIIVHGAGSFGHIPAKRYGLHNGFSSKEQLRGFSVTHYGVRTLNRIVMDALIRAKLNVVSFPPIDFITLDNKKIKEIDAERFKISIDMGLTPVTFGDVVFDKSLKFAICSGDLLMVELAKIFNPERAIFVIDEDGVYTSDPKRDENAKLLEELKVNELQVSCDVYTKYDVTGGMKGKLYSIKEIAELGVDVVVINGNKSKRLYKALINENVVGTIVYGEI
ncbi:MAG TPA: isopentenyl phosphate kinase family protein [Thermoplasmatales archaeon]|nr:isopentenyl phosphate kinase family protein [Thermoplasmatales archaeon]